jgi:hypothetical protein
MVNDRVGTRMCPAPRQWGSAKLIHIDANRTISARSSGLFVHSASDKHSHAFARYALFGSLCSAPQMRLASFVFIP